MMCEVFFESVGGGRGKFAGDWRGGGGKKKKKKRKRKRKRKKNIERNEK